MMPRLLKDDGSARRKPPPPQLNRLLQTIRSVLTSKSRRPRTVPVVFLPRAIPRFHRHPLHPPVHVSDRPVTIGRVGRLRGRRVMVILDLGTDRAWTEVALEMPSILAFQPVLGLVRDSALTLLEHTLDHESRVYRFPGFPVIRGHLVPPPTLRLSIHILLTWLPKFSTIPRYSITEEILISPTSTSIISNGSKDIQTKQVFRLPTLRISLLAIPGRNRATLIPTMKLSASLRGLRILDPSHIRNSYLRF